MTQTFNEDVDINGKLTVDGEADETQVTVRAHSIQTQPLQSWQDNTGEGLVEVASDGRLQVGDDPVSGTPEALLEVNRVAGSASKPKRGLHVAGEIADDDSDDLKLSVHELTLSGNNTTTQKATALNVRTTVDNADVDEVVGLEVGVESLNGGTMGEAIGLQINDVTDGVTNYALKTGAGQVQLGDLTTGLVETDADGNLSTVTSVAAGYLPTMTGADGVNPGSNGMVPAPAADDNTKYLRGDGQWVQPSFDIGADGVSQFPINESETLSINAGSNVTVDYDAVGKSVTINADAAPYIPPSDGITFVKGPASNQTITSANVPLQIQIEESCSDFTFDPATYRLTCQRTGRYRVTGGFPIMRSGTLSVPTTVYTNFWKVSTPSNTFVANGWTVVPVGTNIYDINNMDWIFDAEVGDQFFFDVGSVGTSGVLYIPQPSVGGAYSGVEIRDAYMSGPSGDNIELQRSDDFVQWRVSDGVSAWQNLFSLSELNGVDAPYISLKPTGVNQTLPESPIAEAPILFLEDQNSGDFSYDPVSGKITVITPGIYLVNAQFPVESFNFSNAAVGGFSLRYTDHSDGDNEIFVDNATTQHSSGTTLDYASFSGKVIYLDTGDKVWVQGRNATVGTTDLRVPSWAGVGAGISITSVEKNGPRGYNIELQNSGTHVQWRQDDGSASWQNLVSLSDINGADAPHFIAAQPEVQQNLSTTIGTYTTIDFNEVSNSGDFSFNPATNEVTVLTTGIYTIVPSVHFTVTGATHVGHTQVTVFRTRDAVETAISTSLNQRYQVYSSHTKGNTVELEAGDVLKVQGRAIGSGTVSLLAIESWGLSSLLIFSPLRSGSNGEGADTISGMSTASLYGVDSDKIEIKPGECLDSTGSVKITLASPVEIETASPGANGYSTDVTYTSGYSIYYTHVIYSATESPSVAGLISSSATSPVMPTGYTHSRFLSPVIIRKPSPTSIDVLEFFTDSGYPSRQFHLGDQWLSYYQSPIDDTTRNMVDLSDIIDTSEITVDVVDLDFEFGGSGIANYSLYTADATSARRGSLTISQNGTYRVNFKPETDALWIRNFSGTTQILSVFIRGFKYLAG